MSPEQEMLGAFALRNWRGQTFRVHPQSEQLSNPGEVVLQVWSNGRWEDFLRERRSHILLYVAGEAPDPSAKEQPMPTPKKRAEAETVVAGTEAANGQGVKLTSKEKKALADLWKSSSSAGHDFGFTDELPSVPKSLRIVLVGDLQTKELIEVAEPVTTDAGTLTQFVFTDLGRQVFKDFDNSPDLKDEKELSMVTKAPAKGKPGKQGKPKADKAAANGKGKPTVAAPSNGKPRADEAATGKRQAILQYLMEAKAFNAKNAVDKDELFAGANVGNAVFSAMEKRGHVAAEKGEDKKVSVFITPEGRQLVRK